MSKQNKLEATMDEYFVKNAPFQIPPNGRKTLVEWAPILALIWAVLSFLSVISLWNAGHKANELVNLANSYATAAGVDTVERLGASYYAALLVLAAQGVLMLLAYSGLKARSKSRGWDLLLLGVAANFLYGIVVAFTHYGSLANIIFSIVGALIGLFILAQIRSFYTDGKAPARHPAHKS